MMTRKTRVGIVLLVVSILLGQASRVVFIRQPALLVLEQSTVMAASDKENAQPENRVAGALIPINTASLELLITLPGIGPVYAKNIIEEREKAFFRTFEDLLRVRGIGPARLAAIRDLITLDVPGEQDR